MRKPGQLFVLASGSSTRLALLQSMGLNVRVSPVFFDETMFRNSARDAGMTDGDIALGLAHAKAKRYYQRDDADNDAIIIAADQILSCDGVGIDKASDLKQLRKTLLFLRGRQHKLLSATVLYQRGRALWQYLEIPCLTMRNFSDAFLDGYLKAHGKDVLSSVGGYHFEGAGVQLFSSVEGNQDAIMGLPRLALLQALRHIGLLEN